MGKVSPREGEKPVWQLVGEGLRATGVPGFTQQAECPLPEATQKSLGGEWIIKRQTWFQQGPAPQVPRGGTGGRSWNGCLDRRHLLVMRQETEREDLLAPVWASADSQNCHHMAAGTALLFTSFPLKGGQDTQVHTAIKHSIFSSNFHSMT